MKLEKTTDHFIEFRPCARRGGCWLFTARCWRWTSMVRIGRGVNACEPLSAFHEVKERLPARLGCRFIMRFIQKHTGRAVQEDRVIMLEIVGSDRGGVVSDCRHPRARLVSQILHHLRG